MLGSFAEDPFGMRPGLGGRVPGRTAARPGPGRALPERIA